jgi:hypothetical protein
VGEQAAAVAGVGRVAPVPRTQIALANILYILYNIFMKTITTTNARKHIAKLVNAVRERGEVIAIGKRNVPEVLLIKFPGAYDKTLSDITNINVYSESFKFLDDEPDIYSAGDLKKR